MKRKLFYLITALPGEKPYLKRWYASFGFNLAGLNILIYAETQI